MGLIGECALLLVFGGLIILMLNTLTNRHGHLMRPANLVVVAQDRAEVIEGALNDLLREARRGGCQWQRVTLIDAGSHDETPLIVERLARDHPGFEARLAGEADRRLLAELAPPGSATVLVNLDAAGVRVLAGALANACEALQQP